MLRKAVFHVAAALAAAVMALGAAAQEALDVGISPTPPFGGDNGSYVELMNAIAEVADLEINYVPLPYGEHPEALTSGKIDIKASPYMASPENMAKGISYTAPVFTFGEGLIVPASDATAYKTFVELGGPIGVVGNPASYVNALKAGGVEARSYPTSVELIAAVEAGEVRGAFYPDSSFALLQEDGQYPNVRLVESYVTTLVTPVSIGVRSSEPELLARLNDALATLEANGKLGEIQRRWHMAP